MRILKRTPRDDRPSLMPAAVDKDALRERLERANYLQARYHAPSDIADAAVRTMDIPGQTLLAIEMREHEREAFTFDYDPFGAL